MRVCSASLTLAIAYLRQPSAASPPLCDPLSKVSRHRALIVISHLSLPAMHTYGCHLPVQARLTKYVTSETQTETHRHPHCGEEPSESLAAWRMARVAPTRTAARHGAPQHTRRRQTRLTPAASAGYSDAGSSSTAAGILLGFNNYGTTHTHHNLKRSFGKE